MLNESRLNVYIQAADLPARTRERIQAQIESALRAIPGWAWRLLSARLDELGVRASVSVVPASDQGNRLMSCGEAAGRPAVQLYPRINGEAVHWGQDRRYLAAKAVAYLAAPPPGSAFWDEWRGAIETDWLQSKARDAGETWTNATDLDLYLEMFAAYALNPGHTRWSDLPAVAGLFRRLSGDDE